MKKVIFIDPFSEEYYGDKLFGDPSLNRDHCLRPYERLRERLRQREITVHTADKLWSGQIFYDVADYYSFGITSNYEQLVNRPRLTLKGFFIFEPPVVDPLVYKRLPRLTNIFQKVYLHNTSGDGYSLKNVNLSKLNKLYWPQPFRQVLHDYWSAGERVKKIVMINSNHRPRSCGGENYRKRIEALSALSQYQAIDLYGRNWGERWRRSSLWLPYWRHRKKIMEVYRGSCQSKYQMLSRYTFSLCIENMEMDGYCTEKLFDCLYAGTVPLYLGSKKIEHDLPKNIFIDCRGFGSWKELWDYARALPQPEIRSLREAGRAFVQSNEFKKYYWSLEHNFGLA